MAVLWPGGLLGIDLSFSLVLAALAAATAPASTMMTIRQTGARGEFVDTLLQWKIDSMTQNVEPLRRNTIPCCVIARASLLAVIRLLRDVLRAHARALPHALADLPPLPVRFLRFPDR